MTEKKLERVRWYMLPEKKLESVRWYIDWQEECYRSGDKGALIRLIHCYAGAGEKLPDWIMEAFTTSFRKWDTGESDTLDDAFEIKPRSKKEKLWLKKYNLIVNDIIFARLNGGHINDDLMNEIAKNHGVNRTYVWAMYKEMIELFKKDSGDPSTTIDYFFKG